MYEDIGRIPIISISGYKNVSDYVCDLPLPQAYPLSSKLIENKTLSDAKVEDISEEQSSLLAKALSSTNLNNLKFNQTNIPTAETLPKSFLKLFENNLSQFENNDTFKFLFNERSNESFEEKDKVYNVVCTQPLKISIKKSKIKEKDGTKVKKKRKIKLNSSETSIPVESVKTDSSLNNAIQESQESTFIEKTLESTPNKTVNERIPEMPQNLDPININSILSDTKVPLEADNNLSGVSEKSTTLLNESTNSINLDNSINKILCAPVFLYRNNAQNKSSDNESRGIFDEEPINEQLPGSISEAQSRGIIDGNSQSIGILPSLEDAISAKSPASFHSNYSINTNGICTPIATSITTNNTSLNPLSTNNQFPYYQNTTTTTTNVPLIPSASSNDLHETSHAPTGLSAYLPPGASSNLKFSNSSSSSRSSSRSNSDREKSDKSHSLKNTCRSMSNANSDINEEGSVLTNKTDNVSGTSSNSDNEKQPFPQKKRGRPGKVATNKGKSKGQHNNKDSSYKTKPKSQSEKRGPRKRRSELEDLMIWQIKDLSTKNTESHEPTYTGDMVERVKIRRQEQKKTNQLSSNHHHHSQMKNDMKKRKKIYSDSSSEDEGVLSRRTPKNNNYLSDASSGREISLNGGGGGSDVRRRKSSGGGFGTPHHSHKKNSVSASVGISSDSLSSSSSDNNSPYTHSHNNNSSKPRNSTESFKKSHPSKFQNNMKSKSVNRKSSDRKNSGSDMSPILNSERKPDIRHKKNKSIKRKVFTGSSSSLGSHDEDIKMKKSVERAQTPDTLPFTRSDSEFDIDLFSKFSGKSKKKSKRDVPPEKKRVPIYSNSSSSLTSDSSSDKDEIPSGSKMPNSYHHHPESKTMRRSSSVCSIHDATSRYSSANADAEKRQKSKELSATAVTLSSFHDLLQNILKKIEDLDLFEISQRLSLDSKIEDVILRKYNHDDQEGSGFEENEIGNLLPHSARLLPEELNILEIQTRQIRVAPGSISSIPTGWLVRFLTLLMLHMRSAAHGPPRYPSSTILKEVSKAIKKATKRETFSDDAVMQALWNHSVIGHMLIGVSSAVIALNIIDAPDIPRSYLMEDLIETIAVVSHKVLLNVIFLAPNSAFDAKNSSNQISVKLISFLGRSLTSILSGMSSLIRMQPGKFADNIVFRLTELGLSVPIHYINSPLSAFVKSSATQSQWQADLNSAALGIIGGIYSQYEGHRKLISEEIFSAMIPNQASTKNNSDGNTNSKKVSRNYLLHITHSQKILLIHPLTGVLMTIVQSLAIAPSNYSAFHWLSGQQQPVCVCQSCQSSSSSLLNQPRASDRATTTTTMSNSSLCSSIAGKRTYQNSSFPSLTYPPSDIDLSRVNKEEKIILNSSQQLTVKHATYLIFSLIKKLTIKTEFDSRVTLEALINDTFEVFQKASLEWPVSHTIISAMGTSLVQCMINLSSNKDKLTSERLSYTRIFCLENLGHLLRNLIDLDEKTNIKTEQISNVELINNLVSTTSFLASPINSLMKKTNKGSNDVYPQLLSLRMEHFDGLCFYSRRFHVASVLAELSKKNSSLAALFNNESDVSVLFSFKRQLIGEINTTHHSVSGIIPWCSGKRSLSSNSQLITSCQSPIASAGDGNETTKFQCLYSHPSNVTKSSLFYCIHTGFGLSQASCETAATEAISASQRLIASRQFVPNCEVLYSYICKALSDSSVLIRSKALKILGYLIEKKPAILLNQSPFVNATDEEKSKNVDLNRIIKNRLMDQSICVREATVDLLSRLIILKVKENDKVFTPVLNEYLPLLSNRILDKGLSVRKRAIKCFREILLSHQDCMISAQQKKIHINNEQIFDFCAKLIRRLNDEESIRKTVIEIFQCLWFTPSTQIIQKMTTSSANIRMKSKTQIVLHKIQSISNTIIALKISNSDLILDLFRSLMDSSEVVQGKNQFIESCLEIIEEILHILEEYISLAGDNIRIKFEKKNQISGFLIILNYIFSLSVNENVNIISTFSLCGLPIYRYLARLFNIILIGIERDPNHVSQFDQGRDTVKPIIESNNVYAIHNLISATNYAIQQWRMVLISFLTHQAEQMQNVSSSAGGTGAKKKRNHQFKFDLLDTLILPISMENIDRFQEELIRLAQCQGRLVVDSSLSCLGSMLSCDILLKPLDYFLVSKQATNKADKSHHLSSSDESSTNESSSSGVASEKDVINHQINHVIDRDMILSFSSSTRFTVCFAQFFTLLIDLANELNNPNDLPVSKIVAREHSLMQRYRPSLMRALYIVGLIGKHVSLEVIKASAESLIENPNEIITMYHNQERAQHKLKTIKKMLNCLSTPLFNYKIVNNSKCRQYDPLRDQVYIVLMYFIRRALQMDPINNQSVKKRQNCDIDVEVGKKGISGITLLTHRYHWLILESSIKQALLDILSSPDYAKDIKYDLQIYVVDAISQHLNEYETNKFSQSQSAKLGQINSQGNTTSTSIINNNNEESIKHMHDFESSHANTVAQVFYQTILENAITVPSNALRNSSLNFFSTVFKFGLIPPSHSLSSIICLTTDPDAQISIKATNQLNQIENRFPGHSVLRAMAGVRSSFQLYKCIHNYRKQTHEKSLNIVITNDFVRGVNFSNCLTSQDEVEDVKKDKKTSENDTVAASSTKSPGSFAVSVSNVIYSLIKTNRQARRSFLANLVGLFSIDSLPTSSELSIDELVFLSDQLAHLPYNSWDEVLFVNHYTDIRAALMSSSFMKNFQDTIHTGLNLLSIENGKNRTQEELNKKLTSLIDKADDELAKLMIKRQDKRKKNESTSWDTWLDMSIDSQSTSDRPHEVNLSKLLSVALEKQKSPSQAKVWTIQSAIAILLTFVKSFLKAAYNITDFKQQSYSPTDSAKQWDKPALLNSPEKFANYISNGIIYLPKALSVCRYFAEKKATDTPLTPVELQSLVRLWLVVKHLNLKMTPNDNSTSLPSVNPPTQNPNNKVSTSNSATAQQQENLNTHPLTQYEGKLANEEQGKSLPANSDLVHSQEIRQQYKKDKRQIINRNQEDAKIVAKRPKKANSDDVTISSVSSVLSDDLSSVSSSLE